MCESLGGFRLEIAQDNHPDALSRTAQLVEVIEILWSIQVRDDDARIVEVLPKGNVSRAPAHCMVGSESRTVELFQKLLAVGDVGIDQQRVRIVHAV